MFTVAILVNRYSIVNYKHVLFIFLAT